MTRPVLLAVAGLGDRLEWLLLRDILLGTVAFGGRGGKPDLVPAGLFALLSDPGDMVLVADIVGEGAVGGGGRPCNTADGGLT